MVGLASNAATYLSYLALTQFIGHKTSMTLTTLLGIYLNYLMNKLWSFQHVGDFKRSSTRHLLVYATGYLLNLVILAGFVDGLGYPHQLVQGLTILGLAPIFFLLQRYWIFPTKNMN